MAVQRGPRSYQVHPSRLQVRVRSYKALSLAAQLAQPPAPPAQAGDMPGHCGRVLLWPVRLAPGPPWLLGGHLEQRQRPAHPLYCDWVLACLMCLAVACFDAQAAL